MNPLTCTEFVELILNFLDEELEPDHRGAFELHMAGCQSCTVVIETYRATITVGRSLAKSDEGLPPSLEAKLKAALAAEGLA